MTGSRVTETDKTDISVAVVLWPADDTASCEIAGGHRPPLQGSRVTFCRISFLRVNFPVRAQSDHFCATVFLLMRVVAGLVLIVAVVAAAVVYGQEELGLLGRYDDVRRIPEKCEGTQ